MKSSCCARSGVTVVGAPTKLSSPAFIAGMRPENWPAKISILRPIFAPIALMRSTLKPSTPPPSFGMAWGANVPSTPTTSGFSWASAEIASAAAKSSAAKRLIFSPPD